MNTGTILIVDDNKGVLASLELLLENYFSKILTASNPNQITALLTTRRIDVVILDMNFSAGINNGNEGLYWLGHIRQMAPTLPVVMLTAYGDVELAVKALKNGAADFLLKPWDNQTLIDKVTEAYRSRKAPERTAKVDRAEGFEMLVGRSPAMLQLMKVVSKVARTDANILITGENGTGKEILAREIHRLSPRGARPMLNVDMGAISESLFESELFGFEKGAFTDARKDKAGRMETASGGTLFLDEIGNLSLPMQARLLTAIEKRQITRLGSTQPKNIDIRLICATNADIHNMVTTGKFRQDLLYRINTIHIEIPPLRERKEDIIPLAERFIDRFCKQYDKGNILLSTGAQEKLRTYPWYGNIRELEHAVEKAVIINEDGILSEEHFHFPRKIAAPTTETSVSTLEEMELQMIQKAIEKCNGNLSAVAAQLGITRQTLYNKMKKFGL